MGLGPSSHGGFSRSLRNRESRHPKNDELIPKPPPSSPGYFFVCFLLFRLFLGGNQMSIRYPVRSEMRRRLQLSSSPPKDPIKSTCIQVLHSAHQSVLGSFQFVLMWAAKIDPRWKFRVSAHLYTGPNVHFFLSSPKTERASIMRTFDPNRNSFSILLWPEWNLSGTLFGGGK